MESTIRLHRMQREGMNERLSVKNVDHSANFVFFYIHVLAHGD